MKRIIAIVAFVFASLAVVNAQTNNNSKLESVMEQFASSDAFMVEFTASLDKEFDGINGSIAVAKNGNYALDMGGMNILRDGGYIYTYVANNQEVTIDNYKESSNILKNPSKLFNLSAEDYKISSQKTSRGDLFSLTPLKGGHIDLIDILIGSGNQIESISVKFSKNKYLTLTINSVTAPYKAEPNTFTYSSDRYPNSEIIDLR